MENGLEKLGQELLEFFLLIYKINDNLHENFNYLSFIRLYL